eukprot:TRINITY_DN3516_c0_g1_i2.p1 TRINITY_DN3516_c0_g1~~TRINITY_DN3516_c0_g1_i2.p1  ORF type:complete len:338 (+),score=70.99 TRINITY_DN3516_c0_g1_i2:2-1015(+)
MKCLLCCFDSVGLLLFRRTYGGYPAPPPTILNVLYGCATAAGEHFAALAAVETSDSACTFHVYEERLLLVLLCPNLVRQWEARAALDAVWDAMVLLVGRDALLRPHPELARLLKVVYPLLDILLGSCGRCGTAACTCAHDAALPLGVTTASLEQASEALIEVPGAVEPRPQPPPSRRKHRKRQPPVEQQRGTVQFVLGKALLQFLGQYASAAPSAVFVRNKLAASSPLWDNSIHHKEVTVLGVLLQSLHLALKRDIPVYLPYFIPGENIKPGMIPFRFLTLRLTQQVELVMLCGEAPLLNDLSDAVNFIICTRLTSHDHRVSPRPLAKNSVPGTPSS